MFGKFYVGHEVIVREKFEKFKYAKKTISCRVANNYFISRRCVLLRRDNDGNYIYVKNEKKCIVLDPNNMEVVDSIFNCTSCNRKKDNSIDCDLCENMPIMLLGVVDIQPIQSFTGTMDLNLAIYLVNEYNKKIDETQNYIYVDAISYIDIVREIDDSIGKKRIRSF